MPRFSNCINLSNDLKQISISDLIEKAKVLAKARRYSQSTKWQYNERFRDLQQNATLFGTEKFTEEFITRHVNEGIHKSSHLTCSSVQRKSLINFIATAINSSPVFTYENGTDRIQTKALLKNLVSYEQRLKEQGKRRETVKSYLQTTSKFLLYLDRANKSDLSNITPIDIRNFITELGDERSPRSMRIVPSHLKAFLEFSGASSEVIMFSNFRVPCKSIPVRAMSIENVEALWRYIEGDDTDFRAKAIVATLLATGMRPVDITGIELDDIDWRCDTISFVQSKTDEFMSIELFPTIGSAIARYITEQRPKGTGQKYVFLPKKAPYRRLSSTVCNRILAIAFEKNGVTYVSDGLHCPRAVRRSLASQMIANGVPIQKAAAAIGHVDEKSVDLYTELDVSKMRSICLPIPSSMKGWLNNNG